MQPVKIITRAASAIALGGFAGVLLTAAPAFAAGPTGGGTVPANVTVNESLTFAFTAGASGFTVPAGGSANGALAFNVLTNDPGGYSVAMSAPTLTSGSNSLPAGNLSEVLHYTDTAHPGGMVAGSGYVLPIAATPFINTTQPSLAGGDVYSQDWSSAALPGNQAAGTYGTTLTFLAVGV